MNHSIQTVSVVIATLGGAQLRTTIKNLNAGSLVPTEVLICIPEEYASRVSEINETNVRVITTPFTGQVAQRAEGLKQAIGTLVMQLDDDIQLAPDSLEILTNNILCLGQKNVVGASIYNSVTNEPLTKMNESIQGFVNNIYATIIGRLPWGLRRMGKLSKIGACGGVDPRFCGVVLFATEWLPGGCSISFREDLILDNFFPFKGKAYSEDIIHSSLRNRNGISHFVSTLAKVSIDPPLRGVSIESAIAEIRARRYVAKFLKGNKTHATVTAVLDILRRQIVALILIIFSIISIPKRSTTKFE